jgi:diguanylate cyclase (GGDEF)-like protein
LRALGVPVGYEMQNREDTDRPNAVLSSHANEAAAELRELAGSGSRHISAALLVYDDRSKLEYISPWAEGLLGIEGRPMAGREAKSLFRLEAPEGNLLADDRRLQPSRRMFLDRTVEDCVLTRCDGRQLQVSCEIASIGCGALLILLHPARGGTNPSWLAYRASHDYLTGLPNRSDLQDRLESLHRSTQAQRMRYSLLLLDLDHFKLVNDRFGHATGDRVLVQVARRIAQQVRELDTVGRWGGEEFLCLIPDVGRAIALEIAERIRAGVEARPVACHGREIRVTSSIGIATFPNDGLRPDVLLAKADAALYEAKRSGRNRIGSVGEEAGDRLTVVGTERILGYGEPVRSVHRPIVDLVSGRVRGEEAVARRRLDNRETMDAVDLLVMAAQPRRTHPIDLSPIWSAMSRCAFLEQNGEPLAAMFVKVSADFLDDPEFLDEMRAVIGREHTWVGGGPGGLSPLVMEIPEPRFARELAATRDMLQPFLDMGVRVAIGDFGTGCSFLEHLIELPVSFIKLGGSLVRRVWREPRVYAVLQGAQKLASDLGIITLAEGIEDEETLDALRTIGVNWGQGDPLSCPPFLAPETGQAWGWYSGGARSSQGIPD